MLEPEGETADVTDSTVIYGKDPIPDPNFKIFPKIGTEFFGRKRRFQLLDKSKIFGLGDFAVGFLYLSISFSLSLTAWAMHLGHIR